MLLGYWKHWIVEVNLTVEMEKEHLGYIFENFFNAIWRILNWALLMIP